MLVFPFRMMRASVRAGPTITGDKKCTLRSEVAVLKPFS
jgi:hypothetical protein